MKGPAPAAYRRLVAVALALTALVVVFGAYVRLSDAGLGCPDWPGCYGQPTPHHAAEAIRDAHAADPLGPVSPGKAWKEMTHRYLAATLGAVIVAIAVLAWRGRRRAGVAPGVALALVGVVIFQGLLGKWTVTLLLKPAIVTAHLLGGMTILALLGALLLRAQGASPGQWPAGWVWLARAGLLAVAVQIALGGWVSTNYAALVCAGFPACGAAAPAPDYAHAFHVWRELGMGPDGELLSQAALVAIHWSHRLGAVLVCALLLPLAWGLAHLPGGRGRARVLIAALAAQVVLGIANVLLQLPLALAAAHNAGAALLLLTLVWINHCRAQVVPVPAALTSGAWNAEVSR